MTDCDSLGKFHGIRFAPPAGVEPVDLALTHVQGTSKFVSATYYLHPGLPRELQAILRCAVLHHWTFDVILMFGSMTKELCHG